MIQCLTLKITTSLKTKKSYTYSPIHKVRGPWKRVTSNLVSLLKKLVTLRTTTFRDDATTKASCLPNAVKCVLVKMIVGRKGMGAVSRE